jgi:rRNA processing protein Krr1/Pno1
MNLTDDQISLIARMTAIHRHSLRRKLGRIARHHAEYEKTIEEIAECDILIAQFNEADRKRTSAA